VARPSKAKKAAKLRELREVRALVAMASLGDPKDGPSMSYYAWAEKLGFPRASADRADELWHRSNGGDESYAEAEEKTMEMIQTLIESAREE